MDPKTELIQIIKTLLKNLDLPEVKFTLEHPADEAHGDYATNLALILYPQLKQTDRAGEWSSPRALAEALVNALNALSLTRLISEISVAGPGFINFILSHKQLINSVNAIIENKYDKPLQGQKIAVEYTDPNPFKEFHIGHLYSNIIGESISRIYEANGAIVWRGDFYGDAGMHIAKSVWGLMEQMKTKNLTLASMAQLSIKERQAILGQGYALGVNQYDQDEKIKDQIKNINYLIYISAQKLLEKTRHWQPLVNYEQYIQGNQDLLKEVSEIYQTGLKWSLEYFETYYQRLGTKFDGYYPESWVGELGLKIVEAGLNKGVLELGEGGAVVYHGEKDGLHTRVFRNKLGLPTYEAKDLGLVQAKYQDFKFDLSLNIFGKEIDDYYKVVKKVLMQIEPELGQKQFHLAHGMVNLPTGKMSSRSGNVITVEWLLNRARDLAFKLIKNDQINVEEKIDIAEQIGQAAVKYELLKSNIGDNVTFDFEKSVSFSGNSGPYLQYTNARCHSVLEKSTLVLERLSALSLKSQTIYPEELSLLKWFPRYPEVVKLAGTELAPHHLCTYLYELAQRYNTFYHRHSILGQKNQPVNESTRHLRLALTFATAQILKQGLSLLGIKTPEKM